MVGKPLSKFDTTDSSGRLLGSGNERLRGRPKDTLGSGREMPGRAVAIPSSSDTSDSAARFDGRLGRAVTTPSNSDTSVSRGALVGSGKGRESPGKTEVIPRRSETIELIGKFVGRLTGRDRLGSAVGRLRSCDTSESSGTLVGRERLGSAVGSPNNCDTSESTATLVGRRLGTFVTMPKISETSDWTGNPLGSAEVSPRSSDTSSLGDKFVGRGNGRESP